MKILLCILFLLVNSFACKICVISSPLTTVSLKVNATTEKLVDAEVKWILTKQFTEELGLIYDQNVNNKLDDDELKLVEDAFLDYAKANDYMTHISYDEVVDKENSKKINVKNFKTYVENGILHFKYRMLLDYPLINNHFLHIKIEDKQKYFNITFDEETTLLDKISNKKLVEDSVVIFLLQSEQKAVTPKKIKSTEIVKKEVKKETWLSTYATKFKAYLLKVKEGDIFALIMLCLVSFIYGVIHALGPGHGKSLTFAYFSTYKSSYIKAFSISQLSAFIHIIGALVLVLISIFVLESILNNFIKDSIEILAQISALFIIALSLYILYKKINKKSCGCSSCATTEVKWRTQPEVEVPNHHINKKRDIFFILTAGLIPCPGTVVLFIYAFVLKTYFAVLLASFFISFGMGLVMFGSAFFAVYLKKVASNSHKITNVLEILSPIVMFLLGVILFFNAGLL